MGGSFTVFYRAALPDTVADENAMNEIDSTFTDNEETVRTRKHFPETWLWEHLQVSGYTLSLPVSQ